jgi:hypothetical protein
MERLYRDFLLIILTFLAVSVVINLIPSTVLKRQDVGILCNLKQTIEQPLKTNNLKAQMSTKQYLPDDNWTF